MLTLQKEEKYELLGRLQYVIDEKGFKPFRVLGPDDSVEDIRYEVFRANREMTKKRNDFILFFRVRTYSVFKRTDCSTRLPRER